MISLNETRKDVFVFISVIRKDKEITTFTTVRNIDVESNGDIAEAIADVIDEVKEKKNWIGGKIEKIKVSTKGDNLVLYSQEMGKEFNYLLKL